ADRAGGSGDRGRQGGGAGGQHAEAGARLAERADDRRSLLSRRAVHILGRIVGAAEDASLDRQQAARRDPNGSGHAGGSGKAGRASRPYPVMNANGRFFRVSKVASSSTGWPARLTSTRAASQSASSISCLARSSVAACPTTLHPAAVRVDSTSIATSGSSSMRRIRLP